MPSPIIVHVHGSEQMAHRMSTQGMVFKAIHRLSSRCLLLSRALADVPDACCLGLRTRALRCSMHLCMPTATTGSDSAITAPSFSFFVHACIQIAHRDIVGIRQSRTSQGFCSSQCLAFILCFLSCSALRSSCLCSSAFSMLPCASCFLFCLAVRTNLGAT
jgi:hypothetical protein